MTGLVRNLGSQNITFGMINVSTGLPLAGLTITGFVTKDNGSQASTAGTFTDKTNGQYNYAPTQAETNATDVGFAFTNAGAIPVYYDFHTDVADANGLQSVNVGDWNGTVVATPATAGIPDINVKNMNNVAATSITTINANQGTTQPVNFTGTAGSALVKSDMVDIAGAAVSTTTAQIGVNVVSVAAAASNIKKNASTDISFVMTDSTTHAPKTGLTVTAQRSMDGGAFTTCTNSVTEISAGWYNLVLAAADTNANCIGYKFTATAADDTDITVFTQP